MSRIKNFYQWVKFLHEHGECWSKLSLLSDAWYNSKHFKPIGIWPYSMEYITNEK